MKKLLSICCLGLGLSLTSCVVPVDGMNYDPGNYSPGNSYSGDAQDGFRKGYEFGRQDVRAGRNENFGRYSSEYMALTKDQFREGYTKGYENYHPHYGNGGYNAGPGAVTAVVGQGQIRIMNGGRTVSTIRTAAPNIEKHHFTNGKQQMVVKSRGNHGPATVELFDVQTGALRDKVLAYSIEYGNPSWARGMQD